jgi:hypothetical protein
MPEPAALSRPAIEATYKARDVEGIVDLYFYRRIGFWLAQFFARLKMTPTAVTLLGGFFGIVAGHLYYYRSLPINILGMALHVFANALDNADGQLARLTNRRSQTGRILDSLVDHLIFVSIYFHLVLRASVEGASPAVWLLALAAGISHALQGAAADYFRNGYLYFVNGRSRADWHSSSNIANEFRALNWRTSPWSKFLLALYLNFTRQQELLSPHLRQLQIAAERSFANGIPDWLQTQYRQYARPMLKAWGLLMTNARMFFLFLFLILDRPTWYFWLELSAFNLLLLYLIAQQKRMSRSLLGLIGSRSSL